MSDACAKGGFTSSNRQAKNTKASTPVDQYLKKQKIIQMKGHIYLCKLDHIKNTQRSQDSP